MINFFKKFKIKIFKVEKINTHGGSIRVYINKNQKIKLDKSIIKTLNEEEKFGIKKYKTYQSFGNKVYKLRENFLKNLKKLKINSKKIIGFGAPAKATTALNFFGVNNEIDFIVEDNSLKHNKIIPGVSIPIYPKTRIKDKNNTIMVLAWNFF